MGSVATQKMLLTATAAYVLAGSWWLRGDGVVGSAAQPGPIVAVDRARAAEGGQTFSVRGVMYWGEESVAPDFGGARVRFFLEDGMGILAPLAEVAPSAEGSFAAQLSIPSGVGAGVRGTKRVHWAALVPGRGIDEGRFTVSGAEEGIVELEPDVSARGLVVTGRVVGADGAPVPGAEVTSIEWTGVTGGPHEGGATTFGDGSFHLSLAGGGWLTGVVDHPSHGRAKINEEFPLGVRSRDLGDLVFDAGNVIAGTVRTLGGDALPFLKLRLNPVDGGLEGHSRELAADSNGGFQFAGLAGIAYRLSADVGGESLRVDPGARPVNFCPGLPSLRLEVHDPTGHFALPGGVILRRFDGSKGTGLSPKRWPGGRSIPCGADSTTVIFPEPGTYAVGAYAWTGGAPWSAVKVVRIGLEHRTLRMTLTRPEGPVVHFDVMDADGEAISQWTGTIKDARTGVRLPVEEPISAGVIVPPGSWQLAVAPRGGSYALGRRHSFVVGDDARGTLRVPVDLNKSGGRVTLRLDLPAQIREQERPRSRVELELIGPLPGTTSRDRVWSLNGQAREFRDALPPGRYRIKAECKDRFHRRLGHGVTLVDVVAGETTDVILKVE